MEISDNNLLKDLAQAGCDLESTLPRFLNDSDLYVRFLMRFPADQSFAQLKDAINNKDCEAAFQAAHSLKGLSGTLELTSLYDTTCQLVELLRNSTPGNVFEDAVHIEKTDELMREAETEYNLLTEILLHTDNSEKTLRNEE